MMRETLSKPVHDSYLKHRKQLIVQIILPIVLAAIFCLAAVVLINLATFRNNGDVARWAAISTIWIVIPVIVASLIFMVLLAGLIYLLARLLGIAPTYTILAQNFVHKLAIRIRLAADVVVKPVIYVDGLGASIKAFLGRK